MEIKNIESFEALKSVLSEEVKTYLLLYKSGSDQSECALNEFSKAGEKIDSIQLLKADVSIVRDIHDQYNVNSVPTMLEFDGKMMKNHIKGCHQSNYFKAILEDAVFASASTDKEGQQKRVVVYSTPSCTWCNTLKAYFKEHKIRFTDIDVSKDQNAAQEMVKRSGQQGVPQTDINGQIIVGFDKTRINSLLGIKG